MFSNSHLKDLNFRDHYDLGERKEHHVIIAYFTWYDIRSHNKQEKRLKQVRKDQPKIIDRRGTWQQLLTCTWSCSCLRYSMASSSMEALSVCNKAQFFQRQIIMSPLKKVPWIKERKNHTQLHLVWVGDQILQSPHLLIDPTPPPLHPNDHAAAP